MHIAHVAIMFEGKVYSLPRPKRHHDVIALIYNELGRTGGRQHAIRGEQGFLSDDGRFLDRKEALIVAKNANQLIRKTSPDYLLFSEDLW